VKTVNFKDATYVGDPMNAVRLFNDLGADELIFLDIDAHKEGRTIDPELVQKIGAEARMPFAVGGGIRSLEQAQTLIAAGAEKVVLNTAAHNDPKLVTAVSDAFGAQSVVVAVDAKKDLLGRYRAMVRGGKESTGKSPEEFATEAVGHGAGEILIQSVDQDGKMEGYDLSLIKSVSSKVGVPIIALGGAGTHEDLGRAVLEGGASAAAAGSMFVFYGPRRAVLINYPTKEEKRNIFTTPS
jgi:cyclase